MSETSETHQMTNRLRAALDERGIGHATISQSDDFNVSAFRSLDAGHEAQIAYRPVGPFKFMLDVHSAMGTGEAPVVFRATIEEIDEEYDVRVYDQSPRGTYGGLRPSELAAGRYTALEASQQMADCVRWYAALPDAVSFGLARLYRQIETMMRRSPTFRESSLPIQTGVARTLGLLPFAPRAGTTGTLAFTSGLSVPDNGLILRIRDDANADPRQGFMVHLGKSDPRYCRHAVRYDRSCLGYDGPHPQIPAWCNTEEEFLGIAQTLILFATNFVVGTPA